MYNKISLIKIPVLFFLISLLFNCSDSVNTIAGKKDSKDLERMLMSARGIAGQFKGVLSGYKEEFKDSSQIILNQIEEPIRMLKAKIEEINSQIDSFDGTDTSYHRIHRAIEFTGSEVESLFRKIKALFSSHKVNARKERLKKKMKPVDKLLGKLGKEIEDFLKELVDSSERQTASTPAVVFPAAPAVGDAALPTGSTASISSVVSTEVVPAAPAVEDGVAPVSTDVGPASTFPPGDTTSTIPVDDSAGTYENFPTGADIIS